MIIYQVYTRSFFDSNNDGIGDLAGIEKKLSYIKSLGVDAIWISPFFKSTKKDFGYEETKNHTNKKKKKKKDDNKQKKKTEKKLVMVVLGDMVMSHIFD